MNSDQIITRLNKLLSEKRLSHSIRVSDTACDLALVHNIDKNIIKISGLVHDIAKEQTPSSLKLKGLDVSPFDDVWTNYPSVWHAFIAPRVVQLVFPEIDHVLEGIIDWHTTGQEAMSNEAMIIFIADFIEPEREHSDLTIIRRVAQESLEEAVALITRCSLNKLINKSVPIHPKTWQCWNYYCKYISNS